MKKRILGLAALLACTTCFAGCDVVNGAWDKISGLFPGNQQEVTYDAEGAADWLLSLEEEKASETRNDYSLPNTWNFRGVTYSVEWSVAETEAVTLERGETETLVKVNKMLTADTDYELTAKVIAGDGTFAEITLERTILAMSTTVAAPITSAPVEGVMYKYHVYQAGAQQDCYFVGKMDGYYFKTSSKYEDAIDLYVEYVAGSTTDFYVCFNHPEDASKQYIGVKVSDDGAHNNIVFDEEPVSTFVWNATLGGGTITTTILDKDGKMSEFYLGNYSKDDGSKHYTTVSASTIDNASASTSNIGHLVGLVSVEDVKASEKLAQAQRNYGLSKFFFGTGTYELPTANETFPDVTYTYEISGEGATLEGNVISYAAGTEDATATLTVTFNCGSEAPLTKECTFTVSPIPTVPAAGELTIAEALALDLVAYGNGYNGGKTTEIYNITGIVTSIKKAWDPAYNNMEVYLSDDVNGTTSILVYRLSTQVEVGDKIVVTGKLGYYNGSAQVAQGATAEIIGKETLPEDPSTPSTPAADSTLTIAQALAYADTFEHNTYSEGKYYVVGEITEVYNTQYGNMKIKDADGNILTVYGTYSADGKTRYDALETKPVAGDTIKVYGILGKYNTTLQMKNGWIIEHTPATPDVDEPTDDPTDEPTTSGVLATFEFGNNTTNLTADDYGYYGKDGNDLGTTKSYTDGNYTLALSSISKVYGGGYDATGDASLKLGTSSKVGTFTFTVPQDVTSVELKVTAYKTKAVGYTINGANGGTVAANSGNNNVAYTTITIDTTTTKTITFSTTSTGYRMLIASITFIGGGNTTDNDAESDNTTDDSVESAPGTSDNVNDSVNDTVESAPNTSDSVDSAERP